VENNTNIKSDVHKTLSQGSFVVVEVERLLCLNILQIT